MIAGLPEQDYKVRWFQTEVVRIHCIGAACSTPSTFLPLQMLQELSLLLIITGFLEVAGPFLGVTVTGSYSRE